MLRYEIPGSVPADILPPSGEREYGLGYAQVSGEKPSHHRQAVTAARQAGLTVKKTAPDTHVVSV